MKFAYLIVDEDGDVTGTNSKELALTAAEADFMLVVDVTAGVTLSGPNNRAADIEEADPDDFADPEEGDDEDEGEDD